MSISTGKILVPIGFSPQSMIALGQACNLAQIKKAEIVLLSVIEEQSMMQSLFMDNTTHDLQKKVNEQLLKVAQEYAEKYNINIDVMVAKGKVYSQINEVSKMIDADLIVMGTDGQAQGGLKKFIGSNAERVVRLSRTPVITIKGKEHRKGCKNIILPLDTEKQTKEKVTYAIEYARYWDATVRLISVALKKDQEIKHKLMQNINQVQRFIIDAGVNCTSELMEADKKINLGDSVLDYANQFDADLIIIMTKKEELALSENMSVTARYIINKSIIPVLSIRPVEQNYITRPTTAF